MLRPSVGLNSVWAFPQVSRIQDAVLDPDPGDFTAVIADKDDDNEEQQYAFAEPENEYSAITSVTVKLFCRKILDPDSPQVRIRVNGVWTGYQELPMENAPYQWLTLTFDDGWEALGTLAIGLKAGNMDEEDDDSQELRFDVIYAVIDGMVAGPITRGLGWDAILQEQRRPMLSEEHELDPVRKPLASPGGRPLS